MYIDYKCTIWKRIEFNSLNEFSDAVKLLKETGTIDSINLENTYISDLLETEEEMSSEENQASTKEAYIIKNNKPELIFEI